MKVMRDDLHVLTGSYVLDAISDAEREEFERHLQHCPTCEAEVRGLRETAARLALAYAGWTAGPDGAAGAGGHVPDQAAPAAVRRPSPPGPTPPGPAPPGLPTTGWPSSPRRPAWPLPSRSGSPSCPPSTSSTRRALPRSPGWSPARRPRRDRADQRGRSHHRRRLSRAARSRGQHQRDGIPAVQPRLPGMGDEPVRRPFGRPDARQLAPGVRGPPGRPDRHHRPNPLAARPAPPPSLSRSCPSGVAAPLYNASRYIGLRYSVNGYTSWTA